MRKMPSYRTTSTKTKRSALLVCRDWLCASAIWLTLPTVGLCQNSATQDLTQLSLEDLSDIQVTSVSRKPQELSAVGAAVFVITQDDIRHSGATNIPDVLRMVPGVHVAQMDANTWAISIRGFTDRYGDKVLVLIDGRSVYTPTSSGVNWDQQDVPLEDIERVEVIRGPGGTVWGANAVNGVINIITKSAEDTRGGLVSASGGSQRFGQGLVQYGGTLGSKGAYRVFGDYSNIGNSPAPAGPPLIDGWHKSHGGFRSDWTLTPQDSMTVQGDLFQAREGQTIDTLFANDGFSEAIVDDRITVGSGDVLARWNHTMANGSDITLQSYFDRYNRVEAGLAEVRNTYDLDFQHHLSGGQRQDIVWGFGYRITGDSTTPGYSKSYVPGGRTDNLFSLFAQDEIRITNSFFFTFGSKFEHNSYTGFEYEPSAQAVWRLSLKQTIWASAARAIRQPAQADIALQHYAAAFSLDDGSLGVKTILGTPGRKAERLRDFELGYRAELNKRVSLDLTAFSSHYFGLQTDEPGTPFFVATPSPAHWVIPTMSDDLAHAQNYGAEISVNWSIARWWLIGPSYSYIHMHVAADPGSLDSGQGVVPYDTPKHQFQIHSTIKLARRLDWDNALYYVGSLGDSGDGPTSSYNRLDSRLEWRTGESLSFSIVGQNLLTPAHGEFHDDEMFHTLVARRVFAKISWRF